MKRIIYSEIEGRSRQFYALAAVLSVLILAGLASAFYMEHYGHYVTGMNNQIVWGTPHVFAFFLIISASGALNIASIGTVFGKTLYKPMGRLSGLLALALLLGGLTILVLDLGRPDRLIIAMLNFNFKSIFAWNIVLYVGFMAVVAVYLWLQMERRMNRFAQLGGLVAFLWRLLLTTGTGSVLGFLVAREAYDSAIMAPLFIIMSFSFGLAAYILVLLAICRGTGREIGHKVIIRMGRLLGVFAGAVLYLVAIQHLTNLYAAEHAGGVERFILLDGGIYTLLFWVGQVFVGGILPLLLVYRSTVPRNPQRNVAIASVLVIIGAFCQLYVLLIGGQAYPLNLFPGMQVSSSFSDGVVASYAPSLPEVGLGVGGIALALLIVMLGIKLLRFMPASLATSSIDPHHAVAAKSS